MRKVKWLLLLAIVFSLSGCVTQRKCRLKFPVNPEIIRKDSIITRDTIIYRDRTIKINIPGDTVTVEKKVPYKEDISPVWAQNDYATATAWVQNSKLKLQLIQREQVITAIIDSAYKETKHWKEKYQNEKQTIIVREKYIPKIYKDALIICIIFFILAAAWLAWKFFKR
jgi:hypothetical protein